MIFTLRYYECICTYVRVPMRVWDGAFIFNAKCLLLKAYAATNSRNDKRFCHPYIFSSPIFYFYVFFLFFYHYSPYYFVFRAAASIWFSWRIFLFIIHSKLYEKNKILYTKYTKLINKKKLLLFNHFLRQQILIWIYSLGKQSVASS